MVILIDNLQKRHPIDPERIKTIAQDILNVLESPEAELSLVIVDDHQMADMNLQYRQKKGPTNVIAFAMQEGPFAGINPNLLGDVIISADTTRREADQYGLPLMQRLTELMVHGILHLMGMDHEAGLEAHQQMEEKSRQVLAALA